MVSVNGSKLNLLSRIATAALIKLKKIQKVNNVSVESNASLMSSFVPSLSCIPLTADLNKSTQDNSGNGGTINKAHPCNTIEMNILYKDRVTNEDSRN